MEAPLLVSATCLYNYNAVWLELSSRHHREDSTDRVGRMLQRMHVTKIRHQSRAGRSRYPTSCQYRIHLRMSSFPIEPA